MKRIDRLIIGELIGPWLFGVAIFTVLVIAGTSLMSMTNFIVQGVSGPMVAWFMILSLPGVMVKTFMMATLLAALLAFGRLSANSEIVALRASGADIYRIVRPVFFFSLAVSIVAFIVTDTVVPFASQQRSLLMAEITKKIDIKSTQTLGFPIEDKGKVVAFVVAQDSDLRTGVLRGISVLVYGPDKEVSRLLLASEAVFNIEKFKQSGEGWAIPKSAKVVAMDGSSTLEFGGGVWPKGVPKIDKRPVDLLVSKTNDPDMFSIRQLVDQMTLAAQDPTFDPGKYVNLQFWLWNKFALPLSAIVFGLLGAPLGITNARTGAATGFAIAVGIIFGYMMLVNMLNTFAMGGKIPAWTASFAPLVIGSAFAVFIMWRRNL